MKITGKLVQKFETKMFGAKKDFAVREFVINDVITLQDGREFDNPLKMQLFSKSLVHSSFSFHRANIMKLIMSFWRVVLLQFLVWLSWFKM